MALYLYIILFSLALVSSSRHDDFIRKYKDIIDTLSLNETLVRQEARKLPPVHLGEPFPCTALPPSPAVPTSVHSLRPADIKVVGAVGDSLTVGLGADANTIIGVLVEDRGVSWSIGGDESYEEVETLPNILKKYNSELKGYSVGTGDSSDNARFNLAVTGAIASDLPDQIGKLIERMKNDPDVDFQNDWKVITIMIGGNDLCDICQDETAHSPQMYIQHVTTSLDMLKAEVPRAFVNLVHTVNVEIVEELNKGLICTIIHAGVCDCAAFPDGDQGRQLVVQASEAFHLLTEELVETGRYDTSDDFTVVVQPFFKETFLPKLPDDEPDLSYFAPDCFHLSEKGHAAAATALWNNMVEPVGQKSELWTPGETVKCPTEESPFFFTSKNSFSRLVYLMNRTEHSSGTLEDKRQNTVNEEAEADDTRVNTVSDEKEADDSDQTTPGSNTFVIGTSFLVLAIVGLLLTLVFHRKYRSKPFKYLVMDDELLR